MKVVGEKKIFLNAGDKSKFCNLRLNDVSSNNGE